ncbi:unnamed protein product [Anisakis simplex]|uniref:C-type lectin domain-containing protein n=1 Tax=Anisakis simplex TaxID=6269 RepID=A0A0M3KJY1_ANISI|nr:unnamed protein product [Anisakis simplex]
MQFGSECYRLNLDREFATRFLRKLCDANCFCPPPFVQFTDPKDKCKKFGECVYQRTEAFSYQIARKRCAFYDAEMTEILSPEKDQFLKNWAAGAGAQSLWLGATGVDGNYTWTISGIPVSALCWR